MFEFSVVKIQTWVNLTMVFDLEHFIFGVIGVDKHEDVHTIYTSEVHDNTEDSSKNCDFMLIDPHNKYFQTSV